MGRFTLILQVVLSLIPILYYLCKAKSDRPPLLREYKRGPAATSAVCFPAVHHNDFEAVPETERVSLDAACLSDVFLVVIQGLDVGLCVDLM